MWPTLDRKTVSAVARPLMAVAVVVAIIVVAVAFRTRPRVIWKGKSAEHWIQRLSLYDRNDAPSAEEFLFSAGPAVVPELVAGLRWSDSWIHDKWAEMYYKLGTWQRFFNTPIKRSVYRANCARGLAALGVPNPLAEAELLHCLHDPDEWVRSGAVYALSRVAVNKDKIIPELVSGMQSTNSNYRLACVIALARLLPGGTEATTALYSAASDPDYNVRAWIGERLGRDDTAPAKSFEVICGLLRDGEAVVRDRAARGLGKLNFNAEAKTRELLQALEREPGRSDSNEIVIWKIEEALGQIGASAADAVPALKSFAVTNNAVGMFAIIALSQIEPQQTWWEERLMDQLGDPSNALFPARELARRRTSTAVRALKRLRAEGGGATLHFAALALWRIDPATPDPFDDLSRFLLERQVGGQFELVEFLGELGPQAHAAIPALQHLRYSRGQMMRDYAEAALARIDREYVENPWKTYTPILTQR